MSSFRPALTPATKRAVQRNFSGFVVLFAVSRPSSCMTALGSQLTELPNHAPELSYFIPRQPNIAVVNHGRLLSGGRL